MSTAASAGENVIIVGGGLAGLAAAVSLVQRGVPVTLVESRNRLGGRASSFVDRTTGEEIDNCQHVSMACCTELARLFDETGLSRLVQTERELNFVGPEGRIHRFAAAPLPAPLHLAPALIRLGYLSFREKLSIGRALMRLTKLPADVESEQPFLDWLRDHHQSEAAIGRFWHVVLVSALSEPLDRISLRYARKVFADSFFASRTGWQVQIPKVPLSRLYGEELARWIEDRGGHVLLGAAVREITFDAGRAGGVLLRDGSELPASHVIIAIPHWRIASLLPDSVQDALNLKAIEQIETAPISSVHLWFDRPVTDLRHAVLVDRLSQWMFNRTLLTDDSAPASNEPGLPSGPAPATPDRQSQQYLQVVISASRELHGRDSTEVIRQVVEELAAIWPAAKDATLVHSRLITEHRAVFSPTPGIDALRPSQRTTIDNLTLAGDWTATGWPATMEGAVRSGRLAAESVACSNVRAEPTLPQSASC